MILVSFVFVFVFVLSFSQCSTPHIFRECLEILFVGDALTLTLYFYVCVQADEGPVEEGG